jgi:hypothetical protein
MPQPVQKGRGELGVTEDLHPLAEGQVGGDQGRPSFVAFREQVEEQFTAGVFCVAGISSFFSSRISGTFPKACHKGKG